MAKIAKKEITENGVVFSFANGEVVLATVAAMPEEILYRLAIHGLSQKLGDSYASAGDKGLTVADCADGVRDILRNLTEGIWSASGGTGSSILAEALAALTGKELGECAKILTAMPDDAKKALAKRDDVKAAVAEIKAARARAKLAGQSGGDIDDLTGLFG